MHDVEEGRGDDIPRPPPQGGGGRRVAAAPLSPQEEEELWILNWPRGIALMSAKSSSLRKFREFHSGTVLGKNEYLYTSRRPWKQW